MPVPVPAPRSNRAKQPPSPVSNVRPPHTHTVDHDHDHDHHDHHKDPHVAHLRTTIMSLRRHAADPPPGTVPLPPAPTPHTPTEWDWDHERADRRREAEADAALHDAQPFPVDRRVLRDIVRERTHVDVGRITFLSAGKCTFHKAYLVTLVDTRQLVARLARRLMPRLKTQSEVATMQYLRETTRIPVPDVYFYDANPHNRLGSEYILMSKASGIPLGRVYHAMSNEHVKRLFKNVASIIIPLFALRFSHIGSLRFPAPSLPTPALSHASSLRHAAASATPAAGTSTVPTSAHVGPIVSWPFFGSGRGDLTHPSEINRGPWSSTRSYLQSCAQREIAGVKRESEGKSAPHRLHLDPDEIRSSRHHHLDAVPDDESDDSDEWDAQESEEEWEGPGDCMYSDYRRMQRSTFLVAHIMRREQAVRAEMGRWMRVMDRLGAHADGAAGPPEEFGIDCHDLNLENVFVDEHDHTRITCIIDWESTTTRPLWACAHLPAFVQTSLFTSKLFREVVASVALSKSSKHGGHASTAKEWLHYEAVGARLRLAHRCVEWDGWEEGLVEGILGPEEHEEEWFKDAPSTAEGSEVPSAPSYDDCDGAGAARARVRGIAAGLSWIEEGPESEDGSGASEPSSVALRVAALRSRKQAGQLPLKRAREQEQTLTTTGDICGGRGGELGRRLEAWLSVNGNGWRRRRSSHSQRPQLQQLRGGQEHEDNSEGE